MTEPTDTAPQVDPGCRCEPCPGRGNDGHGMTHCAECCFGTGVVAEIDCPTHGDPSYSTAPQAEWDCANYREPVTCLSAGVSETARCGRCRLRLMMARETVRLAAAPQADALAGLLRQTRERRGLSFRDAAGQIGITPSMVHQIENGTDPRWSTAVKVLAWCGVTNPIPSATPQGVSL